MSKRWLILVIVASLVALTAMPVASAAEGGTDRPLKANFTGLVHWEFPGDYESGCVAVTTVTEATGQATHMGRVGLLSSHCPEEPGYVLDGRSTIVAANGDELYGIYDYDPFSVSNEIPVYFNGGTGRFADASGEALWTFYIIPELIEGCDDPTSFDCLDFTVPWVWWSTLVGSIDF